MLNSSFCGKARPLRPRSHRHHGRSAWTRLWLCASPCSTCCMQGCWQQTGSQQNTRGPGPGTPCRFGCWQPMHTQRVKDGIDNSNSAGWVWKLTARETRAMSWLITAMTRNVTRGTGRIHPTWMRNGPLDPDKTRFIELRDAACTPLTYKLLHSLLSRSCTMFYNCSRPRRLYFN